MEPNLAIEAYICHYLYVVINFDDVANFKLLKSSEMVLISILNLRKSRKLFTSLPFEQTTLHQINFATGTLCPSAPAPYG